MPHRAFIGIGSNLGDRKANYLEAIERIQKLPGTRIVKQSSLYESEPLGDAKTWFVNAVIEIETESHADDLLKRLKGIETAMGRKRVRGKRWGSRIIDLDILFFDSEIINKRTSEGAAPRVTEPALRPRPPVGVGATVDPPEALHVSVGAAGRHQGHEEDPSAASVARLAHNHRAPTVRYVLGAGNRCLRPGSSRWLNPSRRYVFCCRRIAWTRETNGQHRFRSSLPCLW